MLHSNKWNNKFTFDDECKCVISLKEKKPLFTTNMKESKKLRDVPPQAFRRQLLTIFPVFLDVFIMSNTIGWTANAMFFFRKGEPQSFTSLQCSMIASSSELGRLLFAIPSGCLTDKLGRKKIMTISGILHIVAWTVLSFFSSYTSIIIARFILGMGCALGYTISLITVGEISSPEIRGKMTTLIQICSNFGHLFPSTLNILFSSYYMISYTLAIISYFYFLSLYWLIESPQFLVSRLKYDKAKENLKIIRIGYSESEIEEEFENFKNYIEDEKRSKRELNWFKFITSRRILKPVLVTVIIIFLTQGVGFVVISTYVTKITPDIQFLPMSYYPFIKDATRISFSLCTPFFIELFPRRIAFMGSSLVSFFYFILLGTAFFCFEEYSIEFFKWIILVCVLIGTGVVCNPIHVISLTSVAELLPQTVKGFGGSICIMVQSMVVIINFQLFHLADQHDKLYLLFFDFAAISLILFFTLYFLLPEARGQFLADLQMKEERKVDDEKNNL